MNSPGYLYMVSIYLFGDELNPDIVTGLLGIEPNESHKKGKRWTTSTNSEVIERTGVWVISAKTSSNDLRCVLEDITSKINMDAPLLTELVGVDEAYLDVFIAIDADGDGNGTCAFELSQRNIAELSRLKLPVRFTFTAGMP